MVRTKPEKKKKMKKATKEKIIEFMKKCWESVKTQTSIVNTYKRKLNGKKMKWKSDTSTLE